MNCFHQHLFARARNCRGWRHDAHSDMGMCYQLVATLTLRGNTHTHTQIIPNPSQSSKHLISHDNCKKKLTFESQWVKWKQNWTFRTFKIRKVELLHHLRTSPTVPAMSVGDVCRRHADLVIIWFNMINVTEHSSLPSKPTPFAKWLLLSSLCRMETDPGFHHGN